MKRGFTKLRVLANALYGLPLLSGLPSHYDGRKSTGWRTAVTHCRKQNLIDDQDQLTEEGAKFLSRSHSNIPSLRRYAKWH